MVDDPSLDDGLQRRASAACGSVDCFEQRFGGQADQTPWVYSNGDCFGTYRLQATAG